MLEVTNEILEAVAQFRLSNHVNNTYDSKLISSIIGLHEASKPKPEQEPFGYFKFYYKELIDCYPNDAGAFPLYTIPPMTEEYLVEVQVKAIEAYEQSKLDKINQQEDNYHKS